MIFKNPLTTFQENLSQNFSQLILWIPVFIGFGAYFAIIFYNPSILNIAISFIFFALFFYQYYIFRDSYKSLIYAGLLAFLCGYIYTILYQKNVENYTQITGKIFVDVDARIIEITQNKNGARLTLKVANLYQAKFSSKKNSSARDKKIDEEYIIKNFVNIDGWQEIDRDFLEKSLNYQNVEWVKKDGFSLYPRPPKRIVIFIKKVDENISTGDRIFFRAMIEPFKNKQFPRDFDFAFNARSRQIAAQGRAISEIEILQKSHSQNSSFNDFFSRLRNKIQNIILKDLKGDQATIAAALLMGNQNLIAPETLTIIRNSGLIHLISISGLHLSLAAAIFFVSLRFLLAQSEFLTLRFNIKKIAAFFAIISSFVYLQIAGAPVPAVRSFIAVFLIMLAILFDRKIEPLRVIMIGALALILLNPYNLFSISFQLSFAAMLALVGAHQAYIKSKFYIEKNSAIKKLSAYFIEMTIASVAAQIATAPFILYYFGDVAIYGALSNLIVIPLTSFTTMPLGFVSFFLMPFHLEKITLMPMGITIEWIIAISKFVSNLSFSHFANLEITKIGLVFTIFGGLIFCFFEGVLKLLGILIFLACFCFIDVNKKPDFIIDNDARFFAIYSEKNGLVFSKNGRDSSKRKKLMQRFSETKFKSFADFDPESLSHSGIDCSDNFCRINYKNKNILFVLRRVKIKDICDKNFDLIVNLTKKYKLPQCLGNTKRIDNFDLLRNGGYFLYFDDDKIKAVSANS